MWLNCAVATYMYGRNSHRHGLVSVPSPSHPSVVPDGAPIHTRCLSLMPIPPPQVTEHSDQSDQSPQSRCTEVNNNNVLAAAKRFFIIARLPNPEFVESMFQLYDLLTTTLMYRLMLVFFSFLFFFFSCLCLLIEAQNTISYLLSYTKAVQLL